MSKESKREIERIQTAHRMRLIDFWQIRPGSRVLEIGCGQGDTTAALAEVVGPKGFVHGIDIASANYGSPMTLGEAREALLASPIGSRIRMDFETDLLDEAISFDGLFDYAVLSQCSWYFSDNDMMLRMLARLRLLAKTLCVAEWDIRPEWPDQLAHRQAVMVQALCECFQTVSESNIRTLFTPDDLRKAIHTAGWALGREGQVDSPDLQDPRWEIDLALTEYPQVIDTIPGMPDKLRTLLRGQLALLKEITTSGANIRPLPIYICTAT